MGAIQIGIANRKGGIGKSSTALALAAGLQDRGYKVLMIDTDPQCNTTGVYGAEIDGVATLYDIFFSGVGAEQCIQHTAYGDIIPSDPGLKTADTKVDAGPKMYRYIKKAIKEIENKYDFIIYDTPPQAGILLGNTLMTCSKIIIPCTCDLFGVQGIADFYKELKEYQDDNEDLSVLGLLIIKYQGRQKLTQSLEEQFLPDLAANMDSKVFKTRIRESVKCREAQTQHQSLFKYAPTCSTAIDYNAFIDEILAEVL